MQQREWAHLLTKHLVPSDHLKIQTMQRKIVSAKEESEFQKDKANGKLPNQTGHLSWAPSEIACRSGEHHENVEGNGNIGSSASGETAHISLNPNVCRKRR
jgi:hypothetical protein